MVTARRKFLAKKRKKDKGEKEETNRGHVAKAGVAAGHSKHVLVLTYHKNRNNNNNNNFIRMTQRLTAYRGVRRIEG